MLFVRATSTLTVRILRDRFCYCCSASREKCFSLCYSTLSEGGHAREVVCCKRRGGKEKRQSSLGLFVLGISLSGRAEKTKKKRKKQKKIKEDTPRMFSYAVLRTIHYLAKKKKITGKQQRYQSGRRDFVHAPGTPILTPKIIVFRRNSNRLDSKKMRQGQ